MRLGGNTSVEKQGPCAIAADRMFAATIAERSGSVRAWLAGQCMLERIGGGLVDLEGRPFIYNQRKTLLNGGFIAYKNEAMKALALQALADMQDND